MPCVQQGKLSVKAAISRIMENFYDTYKYYVDIVYWRLYLKDWYIAIPGTLLRKKEVGLS